MIYFSLVAVHFVSDGVVGSPLRGWRRLSILLLICALLPSSASGQGRRPSGPGKPRSQMPEYLKAYRSRSDEGNFVRAVLKNGMTVIVEEYPAQPLVCIGTYVRAGYFDESDDIAGISHVLEHMFFKGTAGRGVGEIARDTRALGGVLNASTIYDHTWYYSVVPAENFNKALEIQADALQNLRLDAAELKKEVEVILQEAKRKLDSPAAFATEKLLEMAFEKHRMGRWRIGTETGLRSITREKLQEFYRQFYAPEQIILTVAGDVQRDRVLEKIAELYGRFARPSKASPGGPQEPPQRSMRYRELRGEIQQSQVVFGYHTVGADHSDYYPLLVLGQVLGGGRGSILYRQLLDKQRLIDSYEVLPMSYLGVGVFLIRSTFDPSKIDRVGPAVLAEVELLRKRRVEPAELGRAATLVEQEYYRGLEDCASRAAQLAYFQALGDYREREKFVEKIRGVTSEQVQAVAEKYLSMENLSVLEYQPHGAEPRSFDAAKLRATLDVLVPAVVEKRREEPAPVLPPVEAATAVPFSADYRRQPLKQTSILRGPTIHYKEDHTLPLVDVAFFFPGGRFEESEENRGITELALNMAARESDRYRDGSLALVLESLGGTLQVINAPDYYGFVLSILSRNLAQGMDLLTEVIQKPVFRSERLQKERELQLSRLKRLKENNLAYPLQLCREALFGTYPYAFSSLGTEQSLGALDVGQVEVWYRSNVAGVLPVVILLGDIQGTAIAEKFARDFSGSRFKEKEVGEKKAPPLEQVRQRVEDRDIKQTATVIGFPGPAFSERDADVLEVIRSMVSGLGGRFFEELRDRRNLAYTVAVLAEQNRFGGAVYGYIATSPENASEAGKALLEQFAAFSRQPIRDEEYRRALVSTIGSHLITLQSRFSYLGEIARHAILGGEMDPFERYAERIKSVTLEEIKAAARKYFTPELHVLAVVRGQAAAALVP
ncbi:MAG: insulinase family protein [Acidobacteria bacterium]|nr:insulinase family protein [Acidobacteriota bacterium]